MKIIDRPEIFKKLYSSEALKLWKCMDDMIRLFGVQGLEDAINSALSDNDYKKIKLEVKKSKG